MKFVTVAIILVACYLAVEFSVAQDATNSTAAPPVNKTCKGHKGRNRGKRDIASDIQKELKAFGDNIGKSHEEMKAAFTKFMTDQGLTVEDIAKTIKQGGDGAQQMIQNIQKSLAG